MRYPGSLHLTVKRAVEEAIEAVKAKHPRYVGEEMEVSFLPVTHVRPMSFRLNGQTHPGNALMGGEPDEQPEPAHAAFEEDDCG